MTTHKWDSNDEILFLMHNAYTHYGSVSTTIIVSLSPQGSADPIFRRFYESLHRICYGLAEDVVPMPLSEKAFSCKHGIRNAVDAPALCLVGHCKVSAMKFEKGEQNRQDLLIFPRLTILRATVTLKEKNKGNRSIGLQCKVNPKPSYV